MPHSLSSSKNQHPHRAAKILIIDDELPIREVLSANLKDEGHIVQTAHDADSGLKLMKDFHPDVIFLDIWMPGSLDGIEVLTVARRQFPHLEFVMISGHGTIETAVKATKLGAWDFIEKPLSMDKISIVIANILNYQQEKIEKEALLNKLRRNIAIVGEAPAIVGLKQLIARIAPTSSWVLLQGENGAGKELSAQNIHYMSERASRPFVEVTCINLVDDLIELELFGYEKGAVPGADRAQKGKVELAEGGTLFFDDVADLSVRAQDRLFRLLQERKFFRVGGAQAIDFNFRLIGSTQKDIHKEIEEGRFRKDLYHLFNGASIKVPSLREHAEDIPALVSLFCDQVAKEGGFNKKQFSDQAMEVLLKYTWPGNVRELRNFIERVYILTPGDFIDVHDLRFAGLPIGAASGSTVGLATFREARAQFEKDYLLQKIQENSGNISRTAEVIGLERSYLHRKIKSYGIDSQKSDE